MQRPEPAAIAQEITVERAVIAVLHAPHLTAALGDEQIAADRAMRTDRRRRLHVPFARVMLRPALVVKNAGRADLGEIAGERAFQHAVLGAAEIDIAVRAERIEITAAGIVTIKPRAAIAGDAAVHLMGEQRPEILVAMGALVELIAPAVMAGGNGHVLQMAGAGLLAHRAIMRMIDHQPLDHPRAEIAGLLISDRDPQPVADRGHARHHDLADVIVRSAIDPHRALPAGAGRAERAVPAEIRNVDAIGEADREQILAVLGLDGAAINGDFHGHARPTGQRPARCAAKTSAKRSSPLRTGVIAPVIRSQKLRPEGPARSTCICSSSSVAAVPCPASS